MLKRFLTKKNFLITAIILAVVLFLSGRTEQHDAGLHKYQIAHAKDGTYSPIIRLKYNGEFTCSGVVISQEYALTASHCISSPLGSKYSSGLTVSPQDNDEVVINVDAVAKEDLRDVALLRGNFTDFTQIPADFSGTLFQSVAQLTVVACGFPGGQQELFCSKAMVSGNLYFRYRANGGMLFQGMSGGPVFSLGGVVVGVNSAVDGGAIVIAPLVGVHAVWEINE